MRPYCRAIALTAIFVSVFQSRFIAFAQFGIKIPGTNWSLTPVGPLPSSTVPPPIPPLAPATASVDKAAQAVVNAATAPQREIQKVITGQQSLSQAVQGLVTSQGEQISSVSKAVDDTDSAMSNLKIVAAEKIGGSVAKTVMQFGQAPHRYGVEFATTSAIEAGEVAKGNNPNQLLAAPLAAALRAAENQFLPESRPLPKDVAIALAPFYTKEILDSARYTVGAVSLSIPDLINQFRSFQGKDNAVTVGHVMVFVREPGANYHWWAHELGHVVQYADWGLDKFAFNYVTSCHEVETTAEARAQTAWPIDSSPDLGC